MIIAQVQQDGKQIVNQKIQQRRNDQSLQVQESYSFSQIIKSLCRCLYFKRQNQKYTIFKQNKKPAIIPPQTDRSTGKKTLVIDLDETLVHSSFTKIDDPDFYFSVAIMKYYNLMQIELDNVTYPVYVKIRPGAKEFLKQLQPYYELFIYTASISEVIYQNLFIFSFSMLTLLLTSLILIKLSRVDYTEKIAPSLTISSLRIQLIQIETQKILSLLMYELITLKIIEFPAFLHVLTHECCPHLQFFR